MANEIRKYVPLVQNKGEINYQQNSMDYHTYKIIDGKIVIEFISCNRNEKQKLLNGYYTGTDGKQNYNSRIKVLTCFTLTSIVKIIKDTLYGPYISYKIRCCYKEDCFSQAYNFTLEIPEDNLLSHNIKGIIAKQIGDAFNPFPLSTSDRDINTFLSAYIIEFYNKLDDRNKIIHSKNIANLYCDSEGVYKFNYVHNANIVFNKSETHSYVMDFYKLLRCDAKTVLILYFFLFSSVFKLFLLRYTIEGIDISCRNILLAQNFNCYEDINYLMAFTNPYISTDLPINISGLKQTKHKNMLKELLYSNKHGTVILNDDFNTNTNLIPTY